MTTTHISNERLEWLRDTLNDWISFYEDPADSENHAMFTDAEAAIDELLAARQTIADMSEQQPVAEVISKYGDPEAFGERELSLLADIQKMPYDTKFYAAPQPAVVQDGWVMVPVKCSKQMREAAYNARINSSSPYPVWPEIYSAMINAAPAMPQPAGLAKGE